MLTQLAPSPIRSSTTTRMNVHELRDVITAKFGGPGQDDKLNLTLLSFGFRNGIPPRAIWCSTSVSSPTRTSSRASSPIPAPTEGRGWC